MAAVLIVEDEEAIAEIQDEALTDAGHQCRVAYNGRDAQQLVTARLPDVVVLDYLLPDMNGLVFMAWLRTHCAKAHLPMPKIVLVTAVPSYIGTGVELNADMALHKPDPPDAMVNKPFMYEDLVGSVRRVLTPMRRQGDITGPLRLPE